MCAAQLRGRKLRAIYARDLPLLITTDSILHAYHRSFDTLLTELELELFAHTLRDVLSAVHGALERKHAQASDEGVRTSLRDVDVYVTVALSLLEGAGAPGSSTIRSCFRAESDSG